MPVMRTRVNAVRCPRVRRHAFRRRFRNTRIFGPRSSASTTPVTVALGTYGAPAREGSVAGHEQNAIENDLVPDLLVQAVDGHERVLLDAHLPAAALDNREHVRPLPSPRAYLAGESPPYQKRAIVLPAPPAVKSCRVPHRGGYLSMMRVPRTLWSASAPRNEGSRRSINSKYDDRAGVLWEMSYSTSSRWRSV